MKRIVAWAAAFLTLFAVFARTLDRASRPPPRRPCKPLQRLHRRLEGQRHVREEQDRKSGRRPPTGAGASRARTPGCARHEGRQALQEGRAALPARQGRLPATLLDKMEKAQRSSRASSRTGDLVLTRERHGQRGRPADQQMYTGGRRGALHLRVCDQAGQPHPVQQGLPGRHDPRKAKPSRTGPKSPSASSPAAWAPWRSATWARPTTSAAPAAATPSTRTREVHQGVQREEESLPLWFPGFSAREPGVFEALPRS